MDDDFLSEKLPGWRLDDREVVWLWLTLRQRGMSKLDELPLNSATMRDQIARALHLRPNLCDELSEISDRGFLPDELFDWIEDRGRQPRWLVSEARKKTRLNLRSSVIETITEKAQLIALFDFWKADFESKHAALQSLRERWIDHQRADKIFDWFKGKDEREKCAVAWSWLEENKRRLTRHQEPFKKHHGLLEFFDRSGASYEERELYIHKIKRRWSTQKTRKNATEKKQYNFVLSNSVNAALDKLAQDYGLSRTKVLERLILGETEHMLYLSPK